MADTGATCASTPHKQGMCNLIKGQDTDKITMGQGGGSHMSALGNIPGKLLNRHREQKGTVTLKGASHVPNANFNLFSLTKRIREGWQLGGNKKLIEHRIEFDIVTPTRKGTLYCMYHKRTTNPEVAAISVKMSVDKAREISGHPDESRTRKAAKALGWKLNQGALTPCRACTIAKAKQKNVIKESEHVPTKENHGFLIRHDFQFICVLEPSTDACSNTCDLTSCTHLFN